MKTKAIVSTLVLSFFAVAVSLAADGFLGTWKLNEAKSRLAPGSGRNNTVIYAGVGDSMKITIDGTGADGKPIHNEWTGKFDGKDYAVTGDPTSDSRAITRVDDHTLHVIVKKGGKTTLTAHIVLAADGKTRTVTTEGTDSQGAKVTSTTVYDKQ